MLRLPPLLFSLLLSTAIFAQDDNAPPPPQGDYITLGIGIPIHTVRDKLNSPLAYRGRGLSFQITYESVNQNWINQVRLSISQAGLRPKVKPRRDVNKKAKLSDFRLTVGAYRALSERTDRDNRQFAGLSAILQIDNRRYPLPANNVQGTHFRVGLRAGVLDRRGLGDDGRWGLESQFDLSFFNKLYRPTYIGITPFLHRPAVKGKDYWRKMEGGSFGRFLGVEANFAVDYLSRPWRSDRLEYGFQLGYTPEPQPKSLLFTAGRLGYGSRIRL